MTNAKNSTVAIIGAGLAGLSAGCYAQMNGYRTHIFEHHKKPGGVVAAWKRKGYLIDGAIHYLWGHKPGQPIHDMYNELGITEKNHTIDLDSFSFFDETSGRRMDVTPDLDRLAADWKSVSPDDARIIDNLIAGARAMRDYGLANTGFDKPVELMGFLDWAKTMLGMRRVLKYFSGDYLRPVAEYAEEIKDQSLRMVVENLFLPEVPVWFILMILGLLAKGQIGQLEGGSLDFAKSLENRYMELGGRVSYRSTVEEIIVKNDTAMGVRLEDGSEHRADVVVSAADGYSTIFDMLGGRYIDKKIEGIYRNWKMFRPIVMVSFGVAREFSSEPSLSVIRLERPLDVGNLAIRDISVRICNYSPKFAPPGKTVVQVLLETEWDFWYGLQKEDRSRYDAEKERVAAAILERLESRYPGITSQVEVTDVATPYTTWRYTLNHRGSFEGWLPTPEAIMARMKKTLPGLRNFYMAGQWVMPGGGVPPVLYSGRHVAQILCRRDGKRFTTTLG